MSRPRIVLADDHTMLAEGLRGILEPEFELLRTVADGHELIAAVKELDPDVVVVDISMPNLNGINAVEELRRTGSRSKVVFLTMHQDVTYAKRALEAGGAGFVLKHSAASELVAAIRASLRGEVYVTPSIREGLSVESDANSRGEGSSTGILTLRQTQIVQLLAEGRTAKEVATVLHLSTRTVENHKSRILATLNIGSTAELVQYAIRHGIIAG